MQIEYKKRERVVGMFIIIVASLLFFTVVIIGRGQDWFKTYVTYYTTFDESYNLQVNAAVKLFKADIGKVRKIELVENRVRVTLAIQEDYAPRIRIDTIASVASPTFIGDEYVSIKPGKPNAALVPEEGMINSVEKKSLSDFLVEFELEKTSKMLVKAFQDLSEVAHAMRDPNGPFFATINNVNRIVQGVEDGQGTLGEFLKSRETIEKVNANLDRIGNILDNIDKAAEKAPETVDTIKAASTGFKDRVDDAKRIFDSLEESVGKLKVILENMETGSYDIPEMTQSAKAGIEEIREGVKRIDGVVTSIRKNILIRGHLPPEPAGKNTDAGLRQ